MSTISEVLSGDGRWALVQGDSLRLLMDLPSQTIDALVTDSPYSSGGAFRGDRMKKTSEKYSIGGTALQYPEFDGDTRDQRSYGYWVSLWCAEVYRAAKPGAPACLFTDWRQIATTIDAFQAGGWVYRGIFVWDKTEGVRPAMGRFRAQCEFVVWGSKGAMSDKRGVGVLPGAVSCTPQADLKFAQTGKPIDVMRAVNRICIPGGVILDPFSGGASTGAAALADGFRFIGFESTDEYFKIGSDRLASLERGNADGKPTPQVTIFDRLAGA